jgi:hypothetical protein
MADAPDEMVDELYGAPFDEFIARRDAAAKELRREKRRDEADAVKALRKPSLSAWAVNQLARADRERVDGLLAAGAALRQARGGDVLRDATRDERAAVDELTSSAQALMREAGQKATDKTLGEIRDTLHAAALDEEARDLIAAGRLVEPRQAIGLGGFGFGGAAAPEAVPEPKRGGRKKKAPEPEPEPAPAAEPSPKAEKEERAKQRERAKAAREALRDAEGSVRERERELRTANREVDERERELAAAEKALSAAQRAADEARDALDDAREAVERRQAEVDQAEGGSS